MNRKVSRARMFATKEKVAFTASRDGVTLSLPDTPKGVDTIVEVVLK